MNSYTVTVKRKDRKSGTVSDFNIKFGHVLPSDKRVFKCKVSIISLNITTTADIQNVAGNPALSFSLTSNLPFLNSYSTSSNTPCMTVISSMLMHHSTEPPEFLVSNINHQTINFRYVDIVDILIDPAAFRDSIFVMNLEAVE